MILPTLRHSLRPAWVLLASLLVLPWSAGAAGVYRYEEADGTIVYTNVPPAKGKKAQALKGTFTRPPRATDPVRGGRMSGQRLKAEEFEHHVRDAAGRYRIPVALVWAVMHAESNFDPQAVSRVGASGLMQLMPQTAQEMYLKDIFDVRENIEGGTRYLRVLANLFDGDMVKMVAAYNAGPEAVRKYGGNIPPFAETQAYVRKVLKLYYQYKDKHQLAGLEQTTAAAAEAQADRARP
jgi:hypothetical protein